MKQLVEKFKDFYADFSERNLEDISKLYSANATFQDPIHEIRGVEEIVKYFESVGKGLRYCRFRFLSTCVTDMQAIVEWEMDYAHPKIKSGKALCLSGISILSAETGGEGLRIASHRDYYDMGAMIYEHIPLIGAVLGYIKRKLAGEQKTINPMVRLKENLG